MREQIVNLPRNDEEEDGTSGGGAATNKSFPAAETPRHTVNHHLTYQ